MRRLLFAIFFLIFTASAAQAQLYIDPITQASRRSAIAAGANCVDTTGRGTINCALGGFAQESVTILTQAVAGRFCECNTSNVPVAITAGTNGCDYGGWRPVQYNANGTTTNGSVFCYPGNTGPQGPVGATGAAGSNGVSVTSAAESAGANCATGGSKFTSSSGVTYACNGAVGASGSAGATGAQGAQGLQGVAGATGSTGPAGAAGASVTGVSVSPGFNCTAGGVAYTLSGATSYVCNGVAGATGAQGAQGIQGVQGPAGAAGATGPQGPAGASGGGGFVYIDDNDTPVAGTSNVRNEPVYSDGQYIWDIDPVLGAISTECVSSNSVFYLSSNCTGTTIVPLTTTGKVLCARDGNGAMKYWGPTGSYPNYSSLYAFSTSSGICVATFNNTPKMEVIEAGAAPTFSGKPSPWRLAPAENP